MIVLDSEAVRRALPMRETILAMKTAYAAFSDGRADVPLRTRLMVAPREAVSLFMPAYVDAAGHESLAVKVVSLFPKNPDRGLEFIQAAVLLLEADSGRPLALLEGRTLTAIRTGAASGAAAEVLARNDSTSLAIFGAGVQSRAQLAAVCAVRKIEKVWVFDPTPAKAEKFAAEMARGGDVPKGIEVAQDPSGAVRDADIICAATTSRSPVFSDKDLKAGTHINAVGSYTPQMQEVPAETIRRAKVVVDSRSAALAEAGDLIMPIQDGSITEAHIHAELGEVLLGRKAGRESAEEITCFKSVGIAVQDAVAARLAYENATKLGLGQNVDF